MSRRTLRAALLRRRTRARSAAEDFNDAVAIEAADVLDRVRRSARAVGIHTYTLVGPVQGEDGSWCADMQLPANSGVRLLAVLREEIHPTRDTDDTAALAAALREAAYAVGIGDIKPAVVSGRLQVTLDNRTGPDIVEFLRTAIRPEIEIAGCITGNSENP